jgi:hypothetical protein
MTGTELTIPLDEAKRVFRFLAVVQHLMHQPLYYEDPQYLAKFMADNYPEIKDLYYHVVWNWFPVDVQRELAEE